MDSLLQDLSDFFRGFVADRGSIALSLLFVAVFLGALAVPRLVTSRSPVQRRMAPTEPPATAKDGPVLRKSASRSLWNKLLAGPKHQREIPCSYR